MPAEWIAQAPPADEVYLSMKEPFHLLLHLDEVEEAQFGLRGEGDQDVDIAFRREVFSKHRTEQRELLDVPLAAERLGGIERQRRARLRGSLEGHEHDRSVPSPRCQPRSTTSCHGSQTIIAALPGG